MLGVKKTSYEDGIRKKLYLIVSPWHYIWHYLLSIHDKKEGDSMRIGFIGAGRMGFTLGKFMVQHNIPVTGYFSRTKEHAEEAAKFTDTRYYENAEELINECDAVFLTVSDGAIKTVFDEIVRYPETAGKIICHTSGATSSQVFETDSAEIYGYSVHPIYAVSDRYESYKNFSNAFITIEGHDKYLDDIRSLFDEMGLNTGIIKTDTKSKYHASSVIASNLVCGLYGSAVRLLTECGFTEDSARVALNGLFLDNASGIVNKGPVGQLTGPLERNDITTVRNHLNVLGEEDKDLYVAASKEVLKLARKKNDDRDYSEMENLLNSAR